MISPRDSGSTQARPQTDAATTWRVSPRVLACLPTQSRRPCARWLQRVVHCSGGGDTRCISSGQATVPNQSRTDWQHASRRGLAHCPFPWGEPGLRLPPGLPTLMMAMHATPKWAAGLTEEEGRCTDKLLRRDLFAGTALLCGRRRLSGAGLPPLAHATWRKRRGKRPVWISHGERGCGRACAELARRRDRAAV